MRRLTLCTILLLACLPAAYGQQNFDSVEIKATKVAGSVYMLTGAGGNIGVSVGEDGIVIVDDQFAPLAPKIRQALQSITSKPIRFVLNTHFHGDHTGGNVEFSRDAPIIAHTNVRKRLKAGTTGRGRTTPPAPAAALPILTFDASMTIHLNGEDIRASYFPSGHTDGDSIIFFTESNVIHMGDDFFNGNFPFVDRENGGSVRGLLSNVEYVLATMRDDTKVIPGHGALGDKAAVQRYADMLRGTLAAVQSAIANGRTLDQMKSDKILAQWDSWNWNFIPTDAWIETIHREVAGR